MSVKHALFGVLKILVLCNLYVLVENECITPRRTIGVCKPIQDCPIIINVLKTNQLNEETKEHIKQYGCKETINGIPKICCENDAYTCKTPEQTAGICVPINRCPSIASHLERKPFLSNDVIQKLRQSECPSPDNKARICCPFIEKPLVIHTRYETSKSNISLPKPGDCGIQAADFKIIGGTKVDLTEFPWMVLLEYKSKANPILACGGTLISSRFVLTAGHCIEGAIANTFGGVQRIRLGEYNIRNQTDCITYFEYTDCALPILRIDVESFVVHENFIVNSLTREHDIAIIKMKEDVKTTDFVRPICLPTSTMQIPKQFSVAGWGSTEISDQSPEKLKVNVPLFDKMNCSNLYNKLLKGLKFGVGQICAGGVIGKDSCTGDSGGPLMAGINEKFDKIWYQFGIISFGPTPCGKPYPAVYTYVSEYLPWIMQQINNL